MSLFSGKCQELSPCAVSLQEQHHSNQPPGAGSGVHHLQPHSRKCSNASTAIEMEFSDKKYGDGEDTSIQNERKTEDGQPSSNVNEQEAGPSKTTPAPFNATRVFKKCASNGSLALYVGTRTLTIDGMHLEPLKGIMVFDKESLKQTISDDFKIWGQITLTFRYGREDEEVLGLRFCNEAILALKQLWPPLPQDPEYDYDQDDQLTALQATLMDRIRSSANLPSIQSVPFSLCAGPVGIGAFPPPPSVLLAPAKPYRGSPIGTFYDLRIYASERPEERPPRRNTIRLALRAVQTPPQHITLKVHGVIESRPTILSRGKIHLNCQLNKNAVRYGEHLEANISIQNNSRSSIRRLLVSVIQQVDVCMFTSGRFKNNVAYSEDNIFLVPGASHEKRYTLTPQQCPARQWLALEEAFGREPVLAPSTCTQGLEPTLDLASDLPKSSSGSRNVFAIIVSYYVKVKLILGGLALCPSLKIPFILLPPLNPDDPDPYPNSSSAPSSAQQTTESETSRICSVASPLLEQGESESANKKLQPASDGHQVEVTPAERITTVSGPPGKQEQERSITCISDTSNNYEERKSVKVEAEQPSASSVSASNTRRERETKLSSSSTSSTPTASLYQQQQVTLQQHQPQIHHHHLATTPATTPSPVRTSSGTHLFHQQSIP